MKLLIKVFILISLVLIYCYPAHAQGRIKGHITDSTSHNSLSYANVFVVGTALGTATSIEGEYLIPGVPAGKYTLRVS